LQSKKINSLFDTRHSSLTNKNKMKKISLFMLVTLLFVGVFTGCEEEDTFPFETTGGVIEFTNVTGFYDRNDLNSSFEFNLSSLGESVSSFDLLKSHNGDTPVVHTTISQVPTTVNVILGEALDGMGITASDLEVGDEIIFSIGNVQTASGAYDSANSASAGVACSSALAGTYDFSTSDYFCEGDAVTGQTTWTEAGPGLYTIDDWAYGSYQACYGGPAASWGMLQLKDVCNEITIEGEDNYGDTWSFSSVTVDGADLTLIWTNTYGEIGTSTLTRTDGTEWPELFK